MVVSYSNNGVQGYLLHCTTRHAAAAAAVRHRRSRQLDQGGPAGQGGGQGPLPHTGPDRTVPSNTG